MATFGVDIQLLKRRISHGWFSRQRGALTGTIFQNRGESTLSYMKPPNFLVYHPRDAIPCAKQCVTAAVESCLPPSRFVVYTLSYRSAVKDPWMDNCQLILVPSMTESDAKFTGDDVQILEEYLSHQGKVINFSRSAMDLFNVLTTKISSPIMEVKAMRSDKSLTTNVATEKWDDELHQLNARNSDTILCAVTEESNLSPIAISCLTSSGGQLIHCSLPLLKLCSGQRCEANLSDSSRFLIQELLKALGFMMKETASTPETKSTNSTCHLLSVDHDMMKNFLSAAGARCSDSYDVKGVATPLKLIRREKFSGKAKVENQESDWSIPVFYSLNQESPLPVMKFDWEEYGKNLSSREFGKVVLYFDLVTSTMDILEPIVESMCLNNMTITCIAHQQSKGKGRGGNKWLSPPGTGMFSIAFSVPLCSRLGRHLPIVQHLMTVAVVHAVRSLPGLEQLDLRVKWPNDIYIGSSVKIGGVLVKSTVFRDLCVLTIGCGVNVSNELPTRCINDALGSTGNFTMNRLTCEKVLAISISWLEKLVDSYQSQGPEEFFELYYKYWIHSNQKVQVRLQKDRNNAGRVLDAVVVGIDASGFLSVVSTDGSCEKLSLQPDSNSFDMTKNLIAMKAS